MATKFFQGETVQIENKTKNSSGTLVSVTSVSIDIYDSVGTKVQDAGSATESSTGVYVYNYNIGAAAATGQWEVVSVIVDGANTTITKDKFTVVSQV